MAAQELNTQPKDSAFKIAEYIAKTKYENLPREVIEATKNDIRDTVACILTGSGAPGVQELLKLTMNWGGKPESTIFVHGGKVPSLNAGLINATMAHSNDFDDYHVTAIVHAGSPVVGAAFAAADYLGKVSGKEFIAAVTIGLDLMVRMGITQKQVVTGFQDTSVFGYFCTAAVAGKLLSFNEEQLRNALGIAYCQASGNRQGNADGALTKRLQAGLAARGGIFSAMLAQEDYRGPINTFDGPRGLFNVYYRGEYYRELLTRDLGKRFEGVDLCFKTYPSGGFTQPAIQSAIDMFAEYRIRPQDIKEVNLSVGPEAMVGYCSPLERKINPQNLVDGQFSMPYGVAVGLIFGNVGLDDYTDEAVRRPEVLNLLQRFTVTLNPELKKLMATEVRGTPMPVCYERLVTVTVKTNDGNVYTKVTEFAKGRPENPWSAEDFEKKYLDGVARAAKPLTRENTEKAWGLLSTLEDVEDVTEITRLLS